ncbi:hypothetical protein CPB84DRAFT_244983 [Gymnopilus junonius]|uniref:Uncharacterized protein n=1 Tax=Gymnopilus junonius TaxID=109634 RepID=A0A9P5NWR1_GYMJU|nr:hypothetical protein CPB84DRAFT_244983 [Gymnopilus junonius]
MRSWRSTYNRQVSGCLHFRPHIFAFNHHYCLRNDSSITVSTVNVTHKAEFCCAIRPAPFDLQIPGAPLLSHSCTIPTFTSFPGSRQFITPRNFVFLERLLTSGHAVEGIGRMKKKRRWRSIRMKRQIKAESEKASQCQTALQASPVPLVL